MFAALRESTGAHSAPLFQNHTNTLLDGLHAPFFALHFLTAGSTIIYQGAYLLFQQSLPDILISGGRLNSKKTANDADRKNFFNSFYSSIWHELTHASHFQSMVWNAGSGVASGYWSKLIGTEVGHGITSLFDKFYGSKGDSNWEMVALAEGWAYYIERTFGIKYIDYYQSKTVFPWNNRLLFYRLKTAGCNISDLGKYLFVTNLSDYKNYLIDVYPLQSEVITNIFKDYE